MHSSPSWHSLNAKVPIHLLQHQLFREMACRTKLGAGAVESGEFGPVFLPSIVEFDVLDMSDDNEGCFH